MADLSKGSSILLCDELPNHGSDLMDGTNDEGMLIEVQKIIYFPKIRLKN